MSKRSQPRLTTIMRSKKRRVSRPVAKSRKARTVAGIQGGPGPSTDSFREPYTVVPRQRMLLDGLYVAVRSDVTNANFTGAAPITDIVNFSYAALPGNPGLAAQIGGYDLVFDQVKCVNYTALWWLANNTEFYAVQTQPIMRYAYDPDARGRHTNFSDIKKIPQCRQILMRYGQPVKANFQPHWGVDQGTAATDSALSTMDVSQGYVDAAALANNRKVSDNGILFCISGGPNAVQTEATITLHYRVRRQGAIYYS